MECKTPGDKDVNLSMSKKKEKKEAICSNEPDEAYFFNFKLLLK